MRISFVTSRAHPGFIAALFSLFLSAALFAQQPPPAAPGLKIGWASADLTPNAPVVITGQTYGRVSEGVMDPITATALALESSAGEGTILISCDLISIPDDFRGGDFRGRVRALIARALPDGEQPTVVLNATHTHAAPEIRVDEAADGVSSTEARWGVALEVMPSEAYVAFATERIAEAAVRAWKARAPGGISFGLSHAVVGHNRIMAYRDGTSAMYGSPSKATFSHVEGWEDHTVQLVYTWDRDGRLTGVIVNIPSTSQHDENSFQISADFWHETRLELRARLGDGLHILPQCSAAGDQSQRVIIHRRAEERMEKIMGQNRRQRIAAGIARAVEEILPYMKEHVAWDPILVQRLETVPLSKNMIDERAYEAAKTALPARETAYRALRDALDAQPALRDNARWYVDITRAYRAMVSQQSTIRRYETQRETPRVPVEVYVLRLGEIVFATSPFELYLDYGIHIQERSRAVQTFVVQLAGFGSYLPPERSVARGAYGATFSQNTVGPDGGRELVEHTLKAIDGLFGGEAELPHHLKMRAADVKARLAHEMKLPADGWRFVTDPGNAGRDARWYAVGHDDGAWRTDVPIEASWQKHMPQPYYGAAWYRRSFDTTGLPRWTRALLYFEGVDEEAWVWVNGKPVGAHAMGPSGWNVPFVLDVTEALRPGAPNQVAVRVENTAYGGGIWRPVRLYLFR